MEIKNWIRTAIRLWLFVLIIILSLIETNAQQFVNGKLIIKSKSTLLRSPDYRKFGVDFRKKYEIRCGYFDDIFSLFEKYIIVGFDTLAHKRCTDFGVRLNRKSRGGNFTSDSSSSVVINFNCDSVSNFGFSLELNSALLKDSLYDLSFLVKDASWDRQNFYDKNKNPYEDFKIYITQSYSPNSEGDLLTILSRGDVYGIDSTIFPHDNAYPPNYPLYTLNNYYYQIKKQLKGVNGGKYLTIKAKLTITDTISKLNYANYKPDDEDCLVWGIFNGSALIATNFELKCPFKIIKTGSLCQLNNPLILKSNNNHPNDKYLWSTGDTTKSIIITNPGNYWLMKNRGGCKWTDTIFIDSVKTVASKTIFYDKCKDSSIKIGLDSIIGQSDFIWNNNIQNAHLLINNEGKYFRKSMLNGCSVVDSFIVKNINRHISFNKLSYILCKDDSIVINGLTNEIEWYKDGLLISNSQNYKFIGYTNDTLLIKSKINCWQFDTIYFHVKQCNINLKDFVFIPNSFSPNNDGINDVLKIKCLYSNDLEIYIYNRWGELIYFSNNINDGWDGTFKGINAPQENYLLKVVIKPNSNQNWSLPKLFINTTVHLLR